MDAIPEEIRVKKIVIPIKRILKAIEKKDNKEIVEAVNGLVSEIDWLMKGPWITTETFHELNGYYLWAWPLKIAAEKEIKKQQVNSTDSKTETDETKPANTTTPCFSFPPS